MSDDVFEQAYETPTAEGTATGDIDEIIAPLLATKPWVLLCSIMGFISAGILTIAGIFMVIGMSAFMPAETEGLGGGIGVGMGLFYLVIALISAIPPYWLLKYSGAIKQADTSRSMEDVAQALRYQKSFWKFVGIFIAIYLGFMLLGLGIMLIGGLFASF